MFDAPLNFCAPTASKSETPAILEVPRLTKPADESKSETPEIIEAVTLTRLAGEVKPLTPAILVTA